MNRPAPGRLLWTAGALALAAGVLMTGLTFRRLGAAAAAGKEKLAQARALDELSAELNGHLAAREVYERFPAERAVPLEAVLMDAFAGVEPEDVRRAREDLADGWALTRREFVFGELPLALIIPAVRAAEAQRPPWRLEACVIRASSRAPGVGRVTLVFEKVERQGDQAPSP